MDNKFSKRQQQQESSLQQYHGLIRQDVNNDENEVNEIYRRYDIFCGIQNINNTCYLNVVLQILYNVQWVRQKLLLCDFSGNGVLCEIQKLFALMYQGYLSYVNPSSLFKQLKNQNPGTFVQGKQSDFQEIFSYILTKIENGLNNQDKITFQSLFYGKSKVELTDENLNRLNNDFNENDGIFCLLNIPCSSQNLEQGIETIKTEIIEGYRNNKGENLRVIKKTNFIKSPIYLNFIINRVQFQNNKFIKNLCEFEYQQKIVLNNEMNFSKIYSKNNKKFEQQLLQLNQLLINLQKNKNYLIGSLKYFEIKDLEQNNVKTNKNSANTKNNQTIINQIHNKIINQPNSLIKDCLKNQISEIDIKYEQIQIKIKQIQNKIKNLQIQNELQVYHLQGLMIHCGNRTQSGHYKLCLKVKIGGNMVWLEFNDKIILEISQSTISSYKRKGEICGLLYKKGKQPPNVKQIPKNLQNYIEQKQKQIIAKIDDKKIQQLLQQQTQIINYKYQTLKNKFNQQNTVSLYFFYPLLHLVLQKIPSNICKSFLLYQNIKHPIFMNNVKNKLINSQQNINIGEIEFPIPQQYYIISDMSNNPLEAYQLELLHTNIPIKNYNLLNYFIQLKKIIILKSTFYQCMFVKFNFLQLYQPFSRNVNYIINSLPKSQIFEQKINTIRNKIREKYEQKSLNEQIDLCSILKKNEQICKENIQKCPQKIFQKRFEFWIKYLNNINLFNQSVIYQYQNLYSSYIIHTQ